VNTTACKAALFESTFTMATFRPCFCLLLPLFVSSFLPLASAPLRATSAATSRHR